MKSHKKAVLLSALVFPGLGQITLKRYKAGIAIMLSAGFSLYKMMSIAMQQANAIVNQMLTQGGALDIQALADASGQSAGAGNATYDLYFWLIVVCWVVSIADAWMAGKKL